MSEQSSKVKVIDMTNVTANVTNETPVSANESSRSQEQNVAKVVGPTSSEGFVVTNCTDHISPPLCRMLAGKSVKRLLISTSFVQLSYSSAARKREVNVSVFCLPQSRRVREITPEKKIVYTPKLHGSRPPNSGTPMLRRNFEVYSCPK